MGDFLTGGTKSGTPVETRELTRLLSGQFQSALRGGSTRFGNLATPFQRLAGQAQANLLGTAGLGNALEGLLRDPQDQTRGLFRSMVPFERRQTEESVAGLRSSLGTVGGRFSKNLLEAEGNLRGELSDRFTRSRQQALLEANSQRLGAFKAGTAALLGARGQGFDQAIAPVQLLAGFAAPGAATHQQGLIQSLFGQGASTASTFALAKLFGIA